MKYNKIKTTLTIKRLFLKIYHWFYSTFFLFFLSHLQHLTAFTISDKTIFLNGSLRRETTCLEFGKLLSFIRLRLELFHSFFVTVKQEVASSIQSKCFTFSRFFQDKCQDDFNLMMFFSPLSLFNCVHKFDF